MAGEHGKAALLRPGNNGDTLEQQIETLRQHEPMFFQYVLHRSQLPTISAACKKLGFTRAWFYNRDRETRAALESMAAALKISKVEKALYMLKDAAADAAQVKIDGLIEKNVWVRQQAATDILNRGVGTIGGKHEIEVSGQVEIVWSMPWSQTEELEAEVTEIIDVTPSET